MSRPHPMVMAGVAIALVMAIVGVFAPLLAPHDHLDIGFAARLCPPLSCDDGSGSHVLGTDHLGRDVLSRIVTSFRMYLYIGLVGTVLGIFLAWLLIAVRRIRKTPLPPSGLRPLFGVPFWGLAVLVYTIGVFLSLMSLAMLEPSLVAVMVHAGLLSSTLPLSLVDEQVGKDRVSSDPGPASAVRRTIELSPVCFSLAFLMGLLIESSLSFLGLGVPSPTSSLGAMVSDGLRTPLAKAPWLWGFPLGIILVAVGALSAMVLRVGRDLNQLALSG